VAAVNRRGQRGVSLVELLVGLALLSVIAVLSAQLVIQSTKLIDTVATASRNPDQILATEWIRRDLYQALTVAGSVTGWDDGPLLITSQDGGWVVFAAVEGQLVRTQVPPGAAGVDTRTILRGLVGWRWRVEGGGIVEIELATLVNPEAYQNLPGNADRRAQRRTDRLVMAIRGLPGGRAW
jgi:prepilin-type N-terminal cleavage/methylation domain-containing protein